MATATETKPKRGPGRPRKSDADDPFTAGDSPDTVERKKPDDEDGSDEGAYGAQGVLIEVDDPDRKKILAIGRRIRAKNDERRKLKDEIDLDKIKLGEIFTTKKINRFVGGDFEIDAKDSGLKISVKKRGDAGDDE